MTGKWKALFICLSIQFSNAIFHVRINYQDSTKNCKKLPRFWTNTGFAPPQPINDVRSFFESDDVNINLEIIGSLPNRGIENVRIHWLLNLLSISNYSEPTNGQALPNFNFHYLDNFLWKLINDYRLTPTIEFMTTMKFKKMNEVTWENVAYQLLSRYMGRYGKKRIRKWKWETWNEPDLKSYNTQNFTKKDYEEYLIGIKKGMEAANRQYSVNNTKLRGPAGLFKDEKKHPFCWGVLDYCNKTPNQCPIDIITYHRKGDGSADAIISDSIKLLKYFSTKFPNLKDMKYSNTEADPIVKWSEPRDFQADTRYAATLVSTVFQHWQAIYDGRMRNLESISHDNSFFNYNPNFFTQRTLLARFQMNNTIPKCLQFVQKPVFSSLGLLSSSGSHAGGVNDVKGINVSFVVTSNGKHRSLNSSYSTIFIWSDKPHVTKTYEILIDGLGQGEELFYFAEAIDNKKTNPYLVHQMANSPPFPDGELFKKMRLAQNPRILNQPTKIVDGKIIINAQLKPPFVIATRICSKKKEPPKKVTNLRIRRVSNEEIILFWSEKNDPERCIETYEIFFKYSNQDDYIQLETPHVPFLYYQFKHTIPGCFIVRSRDIFNRTSKPSSKKCIDGYN